MSQISQATVRSLRSRYHGNMATYGGAIQLENTETDPSIFDGDSFKNNTALTNGGSIELIGTSPVEFWYVQCLLCSIIVIFNLVCVY